MDQTTAGQGGVGAVIAPGPIREELKAERIQAGFQGVGTAIGPGLSREELEPERIHEALAGLPGWELTAEGKAITRTFAVTASPNRPLVAFAGYVAELARHHGVAAELDVLGGGVIVTLANRTAGGLTEAELGLAQALEQ